MMIISMDSISCPTSHSQTQTHPLRSSTTRWPRRASSRCRASTSSSRSSWRKRSKPLLVNPLKWVATHATLRITLFKIYSLKLRLPLPQSTTRLQMCFRTHKAHRGLDHRRKRVRQLYLHPISPSIIRDKAPGPTLFPALGHRGANMAKCIISIYATKCQRRDQARHIRALINQPSMKPLGLQAPFNEHNVKVQYFLKLIIIPSFYI